MQHRNIRSVFVLASTGIFLVLFVFWQPALAQTVKPPTDRTPAPQTSGEGLTISPPILEFEAKPGQTYEQTIKLTNPTKNLIEVYPRVMNFRAGGEGGEPTFSSLDQGEEKFSLGSWIKVTQPKIALLSEQVVEFKYQIVVPEDAEPGGHYGVMFFATEPPKSDENSSQISISSMIGSLILAKTPGDLIEKGFLEKFSVNKVVFKAPAVFETKIANIGNVHFKPRGEIVIRDMSGTQQEKTVFNQEGGNVLPDSTRKFEQKWSPGKFKVGRFTAKLDVTYGSGEKTLSENLSFWLIPMWLVYSFTGLIVLVITLIIIVKRKRRVAGRTNRPYFSREKEDAK